MKTSHFLLGVMTGAATAAAAVIFTAPKSGTELRQGIKNQTSTTKLQLAEVKNQTNNVKYAIQTLTNEVKNNIPVIINDVKSSVQNFQNDIQPNLANLQQYTNNLNETLNEIKQQVDDFNKKSDKKAQK